MISAFGFLSQSQDVVIEDRENNNSGNEDERKSKDDQDEQRNHHSNVDMENGEQPESNKSVQKGSEERD